MTAYNIVRLRVKQGRQADFEAVTRDFVPPRTGFRRGSAVKVAPTGYCFVGEWESYEALADSRNALIAMLDRQRPFLEDLGGGLGTTYPASGNAVVEFTPFPESGPPAAGAPRRAFNIVRQRVKADRVKDFEVSFHRLGASPPPPELAGFRKFALVNIGSRSYCIIGEWQSYDHLAAARPYMVGSLDRQRDMLEDLGGGLGQTYAVSGEVVVDHRGSVS